MLMICPNKYAGQIHAVILKLIATDIVSLRVSDKLKVESKQLTRNNLTVVWSNDRRTRNVAVHCGPTMHVDDLLEGLDMCSRSSN